MEQQHLQEEQAVPLPPQRLSRSERARERDDAVLSFAERIFAAKLDASDSEDEQADVVSTATAPAPLEVAAPEDAFAAAAAREYKKADHLRRKRAKKLAASELGSYQPFHQWLEARAEGVAAFQEMAQRRRLAPAADALLTFIYSAHNDFLLRWAEPAEQEEQEAAGELGADGAADAEPPRHLQGQPAGEQQPAGSVAAASSSDGSGDGGLTAGAGQAAAAGDQQAAEPPLQPELGQQAAEPPPPGLRRLRAEVALDALERSLASLRLQRGHVAQLLRRRPSLLVSPPAEESLGALAAALGGRRALADAALRSPWLLHTSPASVQRRIETLVLRARCPSAAAAARMIARQPQLLAAEEELIAENARFLGSLLPARPYGTLIERFPGLLTAQLERTLRGLRRRAPPRLARTDLTLLASQQPTLLLGGTKGVLAAWAELEAASNRVPAWAAELEALTQPVDTRAQRAERQQQRGAAEEPAAEQRAGAAPDGDWLQDVYAEAGAGGAGATPVPAGLPPVNQAPSWFHQAPEAAAAAEQPGAFGTLRRPWLEEDRLRLRTLARLLDARPWQRLRLEYLATEEAEAAARRPLLHVVMAEKEEFARRHPGFPPWLAERRAAEREAAAPAAARGAEAAAEAAEQPGAEQLTAGPAGAGPPQA